MVCYLFQLLREGATGSVLPEPIQSLSQRYRDRARRCLACQPRQNFGELLRLGVTNIQGHGVFSTWGSESILHQFG